MGLCVIKRSRSAWQAVGAGVQQSRAVQVDPSALWSGSGERSREGNWGGTLPLCPFRRGTLTKSELTRFQADQWFTNAVVKTYLYNAAGQLTNWAVTANSWSQNRNLGYGVAGRIVTQKVNSAVRTNTYDLTDQLLTSSGSYAYSGTYDAVGNRLTADGWSYSNNVVNGYTQRASGSLTNAISYDANGNVSGISDWVDGMFGLSLTHDSQGQLVGLDNSFCTGTLSYDYRRLRVESDDDCSGDTLYTYDARGNLLDQSNTSYRVQYAYADGIDSAVLMRAGGNLYALVADHLGSIVAMFDHTGHVESSGDYAPFGNTGAPPVDSTLAFTGRESYFGLYYLRNRWYSPDLGRFLEPDPIGLAGGDVNIYRYVGNSPLNWVDPSGLGVWSFIRDHAIAEISADAGYGRVGVHGTIRVSSEGITFTGGYGVGLGLGISGGIGLSEKPFTKDDEESVTASMSGGSGWGGALSYEASLDTVVRTLHSEGFSGIFGFGMPLGGTLTRDTSSSMDWETVASWIEDIAAAELTIFLPPCE